jgi:glycine/D-amino acid oxidase-like deaminating enzyme
MQTDFLIVGSGLAGITLAHTLDQEGYSFRIISNPALSNSSLIAAGIYNPVVFYRITKSYMAEQIVPFAENFYKNMETRLHERFFYPNPIARIFSGSEERKLWESRREEGVGIFLAETKDNLDINSKIPVNHGYGLVKHSGNLDCLNFINASLDYFKAVFIEDDFDFEALILNEDRVSYKGYDAKKIIFCEGHLISKNPFFKKVILKPVKGEILTIRFEEDIAREFQDYIISKKSFLLPIGGNVYKAGATYNWENLNEVPTKEAMEELVKNIKQITDVPFHIENQEAGIRPAANDRRPIIGTHPEYPQLSTLNGLGTKGVMLAPYFSNELMENVCNEKQLYKEVDVKRFFK